MIIRRHCQLSRVVVNDAQIWSVPEKGLTEGISNASLTLSDFDGGANSIRWHPSASEVLAAGAKNKLSIIDVAKGQLVKSPMLVFSLLIRSHGAGAEKFTYKLEGSGKDIVSG